MVANLILLFLISFLLFLSILLFLMMPRFSKRSSLKPLVDFDYCHRGLHDDKIPENCLKSFIKASNSGYGMELDVQLTRDNQLIVMHDFNLKRACGVEFDVDQYTLEECQQFKLFATEERIPLFIDVLKAIDGKTPILVEIKQKGIDCTTCQKAAALLDKYRGTFFVESFNPVAVGWFKKHRPQYLRGQLSKNFNQNVEMSPFMRFVSKNLLINFLSRPDFIAYHVEHLNSFPIKVMKFFKVPLVVWTIQDIDTYHELKNNMNALIFENFIPSKEQ